jgi:hypothetical protein
LSFATIARGAGFPSVFSFDEMSAWRENVEAILAAAGPTFVALKQASGWTVGALVNQVWSFAGPPDRPSVNQMFLQPFVAYTTGNLWTFVVNSESTANWEEHSPDRWNTPVNFMASKLSTFGTFPASYQVGWGYFFTSPDDAFGATWKVRGTVTLLLPKKKK